MTEATFDRGGEAARRRNLRVKVGYGVGGRAKKGKTVLSLVTKLPQFLGEERVLEESMSPDWNPSPTRGQNRPPGLPLRQCALGVLCVWARAPVCRLSKLFAYPRRRRQPQERPLEAGVGQLRARPRVHGPGGGCCAFMLFA